MNTLPRSTPADRTPIDSATSDYIITAPNHPDVALQTEWLLTNNLGGFAMGTVIGVPTRRYHALLIAATTPPVGRVCALHSVIEQVVLNPGSAAEHVIDLSTFEFVTPPQQQPRTIFHPDGDRRLAEFRKFIPSNDLLSHPPRVQWTFQVPLPDDPSCVIQIIKQLSLPRYQNAAEIYYDLRLIPSPSTSARSKTTTTRLNLQLRLRPLLALHDMHELYRRSQFSRFETSRPDPHQDTIRIHHHDLQLDLSCTNSSFISSEQWWHDFYHRAEAQRHQDCIRDLYSPGLYAADLALDPSAHDGSQSSFTLSARANTPHHAPHQPPADDQSAMLSRMIAAATPPKTSDEALCAITALVTAADAFVVQRQSPADHSSSSTPGTSIIAGYPWFSDWGRDTFISLPGLLLTTARFTEARSVLETFARRCSDGLIPNVFSDQTGHAEYNTVDASLWFIHAACQYAKLSGDHNIFQQTIGNACISILEHYRLGIRRGFSIAMDPADLLIAAGDPSTQLTWMDARRDGITFTPRHGKCVEINALWFSALHLMSDALRSINPARSADFKSLSQAVGLSFVKAFWNQSGNAGKGCLFDVLSPTHQGWQPNAQIRPNQLIPLTLPHCPLSPHQQRAVLDCVRDRLLTPFGVRTLDPADPDYQGRYQGSLFERDRAYHQGTAWPWLLGLYARAVLNVGSFSTESRTEARLALEPTLKQLLAHAYPHAASVPSSRPRHRPAILPSLCLGQIPEVYDGDHSPDHPQRPSGCPAQAWSVAQILQAIVEINS